MPSKPLAKFIPRLFSFGVSIVLILSLVASLTITHPQTAHAATPPAYRYTNTFDTSAGSANGNSVATDPQGNVYVTGQFQGTVVFDGPGGSDSQTSSNQSSFLTKYNANGTYAYTKIFDTSAGSAFGNGVATDAQGNVYMTGGAVGTVVFDGPGGSDSQTMANTSSFLTKYNANGSYAYTKIFDTSAGFADGFGVATDPQGNVYTTGQFDGTVVFDGPGGSDSQTDAGSFANSFLTKYNADGTYGYTKTFDISASGAFAQSQAVTTDTQGNIYITGSFNGTVVFDGSGGSDSQTVANGDIFVTKYNANGSYAYTKIFDTSAGSAHGYDVATDSQDNVYVTGYFSGTVIFDGAGGSDSRTPGGGDNGFFLTSYSANGSYNYTRTFDTSTGGAYADGYGVATDSLDNVYATGDFQETVVFDGPGGSDSRTSANYNGFLTSFQAFIPDQSSPGPAAIPASAASASVPGAPNTGFGVFMANPLRTLAMYSLASAGLLGSAIAVRKFIRQ
jgi:hypothetical protein